MGKKCYAQHIHKENVHPLLKIRVAHIVNEMPLLPLQATPLLKIHFANKAINILVGFILKEFVNSNLFYFSF